MTYINLLTCSAQDGWIQKDNYQAGTNEILKPYRGSLPDSPAGLL